MYGYSKAPVNASVQVLTDNGAPVVATTQVAERDGWLSLAAYGFTFSEKEVRVTLSQDSQPRKVSFNLSKFETKSSKLSSGQMSSIRQAFANTQANTKATCTALYVKASDKSLALTRAKNACAYVRQVSPALKVTSAAKLTKTKSLDGRVTLVSQ